MTHHLLVSHQVHRFGFGGMKYIYILLKLDSESLEALSRTPPNVPPWHRDGCFGIRVTTPHRERDTLTLFYFSPLKSGRKSLT